MIKKTEFKKKTTKKPSTGNIDKQRKNACEKMLELDCPVTGYAIPPIDELYIETMEKFYNEMAIKYFWKGTLTVLLYEFFLMIIVVIVWFSK